MEFNERRLLVQIKLGQKGILSKVQEVFHPLPTGKYSMQLIRSIIVSVVALVVNLIIYYLLTQIGRIHYLIAAPIGYTLGIFVNFYLSVAWVFANRKLKSKHLEFVAFVAINLIGLVLYELLAAGMVEILKISSLVVPIIATIIVFFWNFLTRKKFLY